MRGDCHEKPSVSCSFWAASTLIPVTAEMIFPWDTPSRVSGWAHQPHHGLLRSRLYPDLSDKRWDSLYKSTLSCWPGKVLMERKNRESERVPLTVPENCGQLKPEDNRGRVWRPGTSSGWEWAWGQEPQAGKERSEHEAHSGPWAGPKPHGGRRWTFERSMLPVPRKCYLFPELIIGPAYKILSLYFYIGQVVSFLFCSINSYICSKLFLILKLSLGEGQFLNTWLNSWVIIKHGLVSNHFLLGSSSKELGPVLLSWSCCNLQGQDRNYYSLICSWHITMCFFWHMGEMILTGSAGTCGGNVLLSWMEEKSFWATAT